MADDTPTQTICAVLRGEKVGWTAGDDPAVIERFLDTCRYHGVLALFGQAIGSDAAFRAWPEEIRAACPDVD